MKKKIIIGSRGSKLALIYAKKVKEALLNFSENIDEQNIEIKSISTKGDTILDKRLSIKIFKLPSKTESTFPISSFVLWSFTI